MSNLYNKRYPHELDMKHRYYTLHVGERLTNAEGQVFVITKVFRPPIPGAAPEITLEQFTDT